MHGRSADNNKTPHVLAQLIFATCTYQIDTPSFDRFNIQGFFSIFFFQNQLKQLEDDAARVTEQLSSLQREKEQLNFQKEQEVISLKVSDITTISSIQ